VLKTILDQDRIYIKQTLNIFPQFLTTFEIPDLPANSKTISRIRRLISRCDIVWLFFEGRLRGAVTFYGYTTAK